MRQKPPQVRFPRCENMVLKDLVGPLGVPLRRTRRQKPNVPSQRLPPPMQSFMLGQPSLGTPNIACGPAYARSEVGLDALNS